MPTYNVEPYISKAIESILAQIINDWELIVVNDGTKDLSAKIAQKFADRDSRIKVVYKENGGLSSARNFGLKYATGKYVTFFDPDDYAEPYFISSLLIGANENTPDLIIGGYIVRYESRDVKYEIRDIPVIQFNNELNSKRTDYKSNVPRVGSHSQFVNYAWNKLFLREFLIDHDLTYEEGLYRIEDAEFMSRLVKYNPTVAFVKNCGYVYVQRPVNTLSNVFDNTIIDHAVRRIGIDVEVLSFFKNLKDDEKIELERYLKQSSSSALLSRIYQQKNLSKKERYKLLGEIKDRQLPSLIKNDGKSLKETLKFVALKSLQQGRYRIVDLIYRFA